MALLNDSVKSNSFIDVSVIIPVRNCENYLDACLNSIYEQDFTGSVEVCVFDDSSTDNSLKIIHDWKVKLEHRGFSLVVIEGRDAKPHGPGFGRNQAVKQSSGSFLCFMDADDIMHPSRIAKQFKVAVSNPGAIVGSRFIRHPQGSTKRFTKWANTLNSRQLYLQAYTSNGPTVIMPTWFCSRSVFEVVGGFDEGGLGTPEDLIFFYRHLDLGGTLICVEDVLVTYYYYHSASATFSIEEDTVWRLRMDAIQRCVLVHWKTFTIWNAGKQGRRFFRSLSEENRKKVVAFCDVDAKKLAKGAYTHEDSQISPKVKIPIVHFKVAAPPFIICIKLNLTGDSFENNLSSLNLTEGVDYFHFN